MISAELVEKNLIKVVIVEAVLLVILTKIAAIGEE